MVSIVLGMMARAGESMLGTTFQPLDGLGSGTIRIVEVTCHDWYGMSGQSSSIGLISDLVRKCKDASGLRNKVAINHDPLSSFPPSRLCGFA